MKNLTNILRTSIAVLAIGFFASCASEEVAPKMITVEPPVDSPVVVAPVDTVATMPVDTTPVVVVPKTYSYHLKSVTKNGEVFATLEYNSEYYPTKIVRNGVTLTYSSDKIVETKGGQVIATHYLNSIKFPYLTVKGADSTTYTYDDNGYLAKSVLKMADGQILEKVYTVVDGNTVKIVASTGKVTEYTFTVENKIGIDLVGGLSIPIFGKANKNLVDELVGSGYTHQYEFNEAGYVTKMTYNGSVYEYTFEVVEN